MLKRRTPIPPTLVEANHKDAKHLQSWFATEKELFSWGGPGLILDCDQQQFIQQIRLWELASYSLKDDSKQLLGFGQTYVRKGRHHLGRLAVNPNLRGQGLGKLLVQCLIQQAPRVQQAQGFSLFVLQDNHLAIKLYQSLGFIFTEYPGEIPGGFDNCLYMVKLV